MIPNEAIECQAEFFSIAFKDAVSTSCNHVLGSPSSRKALRARVAGYQMTFGFSCVWFTISPGDVYDLRCYQLSEGVKGVDEEDESLDEEKSINGLKIRLTIPKAVLEVLSASNMPDSHARSKAVADNPVASAEYFHSILFAYFMAFCGYELTDGNCNAKRRGRGAFGVLEAFLAL